MNRYEKPIAGVSPDAHELASASGSESAETALTSPMFNYESKGDNPTDTGRDEPQDDRPKLVAHDVSDAAGRPLIAFYDPEGATMDGEILYARATVNVGDWL